METRTSNALSRELGDALRRARYRAQLKTNTLLAELGWSAGKLSKLETGTRNASTDDIARLVGHVRAEPEMYEHIMALAHEEPSGHYVRPHDATMPDSLRILILHEQMAKAIWCYETLNIPGLLQTRDYARGLMVTTNAEQAVANRMARQKIFDGRLAPRGHFFVHEAALRRVVSGAQVMYEQMLQLLFRDGVRLIPFDANLPGTLNTGFTFMTFRDHFPITYVEGGSVSLFLDTFETTRESQRNCNDLARVALSEEESRSVFAEWADRYDRLREAEGAPGGEAVA
ncbi:helix-turn-helix transcriptional regulator [Saccharothrix sp. BKS2]|uniref:helix-turn-helix domain-containing protein n=1 Tax=Saccharothrix sp. BKS2 TaxID=3064400 RepID=UPI0039ED483B